MRDNNEYNELLEKFSIKISDRPNPVPYNYRLSFRMAEICLIIRKSTTAGGVSLSKINILSDALSSQFSLDKVRKFIGKDENEYRIKYDPLVIRVLQYLIYDELVVQQKNQKYKLSDKGKAFVKKIEADKSLLVREKELLNEVGKTLKEDKIQQLQLNWRYDLD
jgi:predicted transcriptional regulator